MPLHYAWWLELLIVIVCIGAARSAAMSFNRLIDADIDKRNPRTEKREIPAGTISKREAATLVGLSSALFFACAYLLGTHCLILSPFVLLVLCGYSYIKRYSSLVHLVLGLALALAPGGAWWVLRPEISFIPIALMLAVLFWVAGFDIIYSCQDVLFDREEGLHSIPALLGVESALTVSQVFHFICWLAFLTFGIFAGMNGWYFLGMLVFGALLLYEHRLVSPFDLSRVNQAFFTVNGVIGVFYFLLVLVS